MTRPPGASADYVEVNCRNPECRRTVWIPPNVQPETIAVCSAECSKAIIDQLPDEAEVTVIDGASPKRPLAIDKLWAYIASDETGEGIVSLTVEGNSMPLVGADAARMMSLRSVAERMAKQSGQPMKLIRFETRVEVDRIDP